MKRATVLAVLLTTLVGFNPPLPASAQEGCTFWMAPNGSDEGTGSRTRPWATLDHATSVMPDRGCTLILANGTYDGEQKIKRRFSQQVVVRAETPYHVRLRHNQTVLKISGAARITVEGLEITHAGPGSDGYLVLISDSKGVRALDITIRNNIIHDSFDNDLLKSHNRSINTRITGNIFYNQGPSEQHLDINSTEGTTISRNVFFNNYQASGRGIETNAKHFIVVKDSNEGADGLLGSRNTTIRDNVFAHWQGGSGETFIAIGNDGKSFHEAIGVKIFNNLMLGDSDNQAGTVLQIAGARDVAFFNNTIVGDLPSRAYAMRITTKGSNPPNANLRFVNNIWSDPTGTMGSGTEGGSLRFSSGDASTVSDVLLHNNLYWNGPNRVPGGDVTDPHDDARGIFANPRLPVARLANPLPTWEGSSFADGSKSVAAAWRRLVDAHATLADGAPAVDRGDPGYAPTRDILGRLRGSTASVGAWDPGTEGSFTDTGGSTFAGDIEWLASVGVTRGCNPPANTRFCPDDLVTRGQIAAFLHRALGGLLSSGEVRRFTDTGGSTFAGDVEWLASVGVTRGCNPPANTRFCPDDLVTRGQIAAFLHRALGGTLTSE